MLGGLYTKQGRIADGLKMDRKLVRLRPDNATAHYNLACSLALSRRGPRPCMRSSTPSPSAMTTTTGCSRIPTSRD